MFNILLDHTVPGPVSRLMRNHTVYTAVLLGWQELSNGDLIAAADRERFDAMVTANKILIYQQNLTSRRLGLVVLSTSDWRVSRQHPLKVIQAVDAAKLCCYLEVELPRLPPFRVAPEP